MRAAIFQPNRFASFEFTILRAKVAVLRFREFQCKPLIRHMDLEANKSQEQEK
jgi:hypothetical protein